MKKTNGKKLELKLETVAPLLLDNVNGGQAAITPQMTRLVCPTISRLVCPTKRCVAGQGGE